MRFRIKALEGYPKFPLVVLFAIVVIDQLDNAAFSILLPNIRNEFHLSTAGALGLVAATTPLATVLGLALGWAGDRLKRTPFVTGGVALWGASAMLTGVAPSVAWVAVGRAGAGLGERVNGPIHQALIADYYPPAVRPTVFGLYNAGMPIGRMLGFISAGFFAAAYGWRSPFVAMGIAAAFATVLTLPLREPNRGRYDRLAAGADEELAATEARPPSFGEAWRLLYTVASIRRIYFAWPVLIGSFQGLNSLVSIYYQRVHGVNEAGRGLLFALNEPFAILGLLLLTPILRRRMAGNPQRGIELLRYLSVGVAISIVIIALAPNVQVVIVGSTLRAVCNAVLAPALYATLSLVMPPRARALGYSVLALWGLPALVLLPVIGGIADQFGLRVGILVVVPIYLLGAQLLASAGSTVNTDIVNNNHYTLIESEAQAERLRFRRALDAGEIADSNLLHLDARDIHVSYGAVKVLFGVDLAVRKGERIALLGTNGAGKSTLLKVISGLLTPDVGTGGTVWYKNEDITFTTPSQRVGLGMVQIGGGRATFPSLTVDRNLRMGAYPFLGDHELVQERIDEVLRQFPVLGERRNQRAGTLSGGEQQMMALGRALIAGPELLMIDELALGLAPVVMGEILAMVEAIVERGTTLIVVEQSLNVALSITDRAYFMEKGEMRFSGRTEELLERDDIVRSVFFGETAESPT